MKGTILKCLKDAVIKAKGAETWTAILEKAGLESMVTINLSENFPDADANRLITTALDHLGTEVAVNAFSQHWTTDHAQRLYPWAYRKHSTAREFLRDLDNVHIRIAAKHPDASPPRFDINDMGPDGMDITYKSHRKFEMLAAALVASTCLHYYNETFARVTLTGNVISVRGLRF